MRPPLFLLLLAASVSLISAKGSAPIVLNVTQFRSSPHHPMKFDSLTIWCSPDHPQATIRMASFIRKKDNKRLPATVAQSKKNATLEIQNPTIDDVGEYLCELDYNPTSIYRTTHSTHIYLRPVLISDEGLTLAEGDASTSTTLQAPVLSIVAGSDVNLTCPAVGHPPVKFKWTKDGKPLEMGADVNPDGNSIRFTKLNYSNAGLYTCEVVNEYPVAFGPGRKVKKTLLLLERELRIKSPYTWIWPLAIIILIFIALFIIIIACEYRKKHSDRKTLYVAQE